MIRLENKSNILKEQMIELTKLNNMVKDIINHPNRNQYLDQILVEYIVREHDNIEKYINYVNGYLNDIEEEDIPEDFIIVLNDYIIHSKKSIINISLLVL